MPIFSPPFSYPFFYSNGKGNLHNTSKHNDSSRFINWDWRVELLTFADLTLLSICLSMDDLKCSKRHVKGNKPCYLLLLLLRHACFCLAMSFQAALRWMDYFIWGEKKKFVFCLSSLKEGCYLRKQEEIVEREEKVYLTLLLLLGLCLV